MQRFEDYKKIQTVYVHVPQNDMRDGEFSRDIMLRFKPRAVSCKIVGKTPPLVDDQVKNGLIECPQMVLDGNLCTFSLYDIVNHDSVFRECVPDLISGTYNFRCFTLPIGDVNKVSGIKAAAAGGAAIIAVTLSLTFIA